MNALVYHPQRIVRSRSKLYANIKLQGASQRTEDSIKRHEGSNDPKPTKATREASTLQDLNLRAGNLLTLKKIFSGILDSLTPLTLKNVPTRLRQDTFGNINSFAINLNK
jgi:hypothetical protein